MINAIKMHTIIMITSTINCMLLISCKSLAICSSLDILFVNTSGNVLLIGFALVDGMPELLGFVVINAISIACIVPLVRSVLSQV